MPIVGTESAILPNFDPAILSGSSEERDDLKSAYMKHEGDMGEILNDVMASTIDDEPRFVDMIKEMIANKEVPDFPKFSKETKASKNSRKRKASKEAKVSSVCARWMTGDICMVVFFNSHVTMMEYYA